MIHEVHEPQKLFRLDEANGTLPLVSRIVKDIVDVYTEMVAAKEEIERLSRSGDEPAREAQQHLSRARKSTSTPTRASIGSTPTRMRRTR